MSLWDLFSNDSAEKAAQLANQGRLQGQADLEKNYGLGRTAITDNYGQAANVLSGAVNKFGGGVDAYGDASGANGVEGLGRATNQFKNSEGYGVYNFANQQAQDAIARQTAAGGGGGPSGGGNYKGADASSDLAARSWGSYLTGLQPYLGSYGTATTNLANTYTGQGNALNASYTGQGNAAAGTQNAIGANNAGAEMNNYNVGANQLGAIMGVGNLLAGGAGGGGLTSGLSSLFSGFGKSSSPSYAAGGYSPATNAPVYANPNGGSWYG